MDAVLVHGGAGAMRDGRHDRRRDGCRKAAEAGWDALERSGDPLTAAVEATVVLEDDPVFNAGTGSYLAGDGRVYVDAAVQVGADLTAGAVAHLPGCRNPVRLARRIAEADLPHVLYVDEGARELAKRWDLACDPRDIVVEEKARIWADDDAWDSADTVGAVAVCDGQVAVAQSTGGTPGKAVGRVGDAPLLGLGLVADDEVGAAMGTGHGESLMRVRAAERTLGRLEDGPEAACRATIDEMADRVGGTGGVLAATPEGELGLAHNTPYMAWAKAVDGDVACGIED